MKRDDVLWLAGYLEGEGCFSLNTGSPRILVSATDEDVVRRAAMLMNGNVYVRKCPGKTQWRVSIHSSSAAGWMMMLYPFMGIRRASKIKLILNQWRSNPSRPRQKGKSNRLPHALCHTDREHLALGLCKPCYQKQYYMANKII